MIWFGTLMLMLASNGCATKAVALAGAGWIWTARLP
jgi:hypothetical protein